MDNIQEIKKCFGQCRKYAVEKGWVEIAPDRYLVVCCIQLKQCYAAFLSQREVLQISTGCNFAAGLRIYHLPKEV